jgi:signal transduction histidine kinase
MSAAEPRPSSPKRRSSPSATRVLELAANLLAAEDEAQVLRRLVPLTALPGGLGFGRAFLLLADAERAVLAGRSAVGPCDEREASRMPRAQDPDGLAEALDDLTDDDLESAAPDLTARVRGLALPLAPGIDPVVDEFLANGAARFGAEPGARGAAAAWRNALGVDSFLAATIVAFDRPVALLIADSGFRAKALGVPELELLVGLAQVAGLAIERARLVSDRQERAAQLATLEELAKSAIAPTSLRSELALVVRAGAQALSCRGGVLWRATGERQGLVLETVHVSDDRLDPLRQAEAIEPLARAVARHKAPRAIADAASDPHLDPAAVRGLGALYVSPLVTPAGTLGVMAFFGPAPRALSEPKTFDREDTRVAEAVVAQAAAVLAQALLSDRVREAEARLAELAKHVASNERLAALGAIAARAAEEAQHPLASIGGFARRVHRGLAAEDPNREYVEIILRESDRLERLLAEHRQFASLSRPRLALESMNQILAATLTALSDGMVKRRVRLLKKLAPDVPSLLLDAEKIRQVVRNMLENALESVPQGGRVKVETRKSQGYVVVEIASDAPPLSGDMLEQLFVPFATSRKGGDPVGLALAQQVVQSHGGEIRVRSEGDWGVIYSFTLPVVDNADRRNRTDRRGVRLDRRNRFPAA